MTGSFAKADPRPRSSRSTMKRITTLALIVLTAACSPESDARPDAAAGDDAGPAAAVGDVPADLTCETLRESVLRSGTDRDALSNAWGTPESVRVSTEPNRHIEGATDSLLVVRYPGLSVSLRKPPSGRELTSHADVSDNRYLRYPAIGVGADTASVIGALGEPTRRPADGFVYECGMAAAQPITFVIEDGVVRRIDIAYYVD
jgi:hypothetical protein